jgi:hypothetical protein
MSGINMGLLKEVISWTEITVRIKDRSSLVCLLKDLNELLECELESLNDSLLGRFFYVFERVGDQHLVRLFLDESLSVGLIETLHNTLSKNRSNVVIGKIKSTGEADISALCGSYHGKCAKAFMTIVFSNLSLMALKLVCGEQWNDQTKIEVASNVMIAHLPAVNYFRLFPSRYPEQYRNTPFPINFPVFKSHVDGFFIMSKNTEALRDVLESQFRKNEDVFEDKVRLSFKLNESQRSNDRITRGWTIFAESLVRKARELLSDQRLSTQREEGYIGDNYDLSDSDFHQVMQSDTGFRGELNSDISYQAMRIGINALYLFLTNIGVSLMERITLCYSIYRSVEEAYGTDATDSLKRVAEYYNHLQENEIT